MIFERVAQLLSVLVINAKGKIIVIDGSLTRRIGCARAGAGASIVLF